MIKEIYVVADDYKLFAKNLIDKLKATGVVLHIIEPSPQKLFFSDARTLHIILCLHEGMDFGVVGALAEIQKKQNAYLYVVGAMPMSVEEGKFLEKLPSFRFSSYSLDVNKMLAIMEKNDLPKKRLLVVDDEPIMLRSIKGWLGENFEVSLVPSGEEALKFLDMHNGEIDLVLLDYKMPGLDGPEVLSRIRSDPRSQDLSVMFLTANSDKESVISIAKLRPQGYILKSKSPAEIKQAVVDFFKNKIITVE